MIIEELNPSFTAWSNTSRYGDDAWNFGNVLGAANAFGQALGGAALGAVQMYDAAYGLTSPFGYTPEQAVWAFGESINPGVNFAPGLDFNTKPKKGFRPSIGWLDSSGDVMREGFTGGKPNAPPPPFYVPPPLFFGGLPGFTGGKPNAPPPPGFGEHFDVPVGYGHSVSGGTGPRWHANKFKSTKNKY